MKKVYLDYNASTPIASEVAEAIRPFLGDHYGNPSSPHWAGLPAKEAVERARGQIAELLDCSAEEIVFTSGGTESNNYAIKGSFFALRGQGNHIITTQVEHPSVLQPCRFLEKLGAEVTYLPVDGAGMVDPGDVAKAITGRTILVTIMHANNEVGTIQPIEEISRITREREFMLHTDAAQSVGKMSTKVSALGVDLLSVAGHKLYAPKGVGALYVRRGQSLEPFMHGAGHESGRRAGTENVLGVVGLGRACEAAERDFESNYAHLKGITEGLFAGLRARLPGVHLNGHPDRRLANTLNLSFRGVEAHRLLGLLNEQVAMSAGSACHSGAVSISPVLKAMGVRPERAGGAVRLSAGTMTTTEEIEVALEAITQAVQTCRERHDA